MPWHIHFFQRADGSVPALDFLATLPPKVAAQVDDVLTALVEATPPRFEGGGMWEAMHGAMAGIYEVRAQSSGRNHRLFCLLDHRVDPRGPSIICLGGLSKAPRRAAHPREYRTIRRYADEFRATRSVM